MLRIEQLKEKIKQLNVWVIVALLAILTIVSFANQKILDSDYLAAWLVPAIYKMGLMTIYALYAIMIIVVVNWLYMSLFQLSRPRYFDPEQRQGLIELLRDPQVRGNIAVYRENIKSLVGYSNHLSEIISAAIPSAIKEPFMLEQYFRVKVDNINGRHIDGINLINLLSNIAPIVGFFGTLLGLIQAFHVSSAAMAAEGQMTPDTFAQLQTSIMIAIITSVWGVLIKIVGSIMRHHLISKMNNIGDEITGIPMEVLYSSGK